MFQGSRSPLPALRTSLHLALLAALLLAGLHATTARAQPGSTPFTLDWNSSQTPSAKAVAWGDYDSDGDLDLAASGIDTPTRVYRNDSGTLGGIAWSSPALNVTGLAWGDVDNDGDLDLALGVNSSTEPSRIYRNDGGLFELYPWTPAPGSVSSLAWGDMNNDGRLDLALGVNSTGAPSRLYRNDGGTLTQDPTWQPTPGAVSSLAWGDVNNDGRLDLALGVNSTGASSRLYRNGGGTLTQDPTWQPTPGAVSSLAWGDYDGDDNLDLAFGVNGGGPSRVYRNSAGTLVLASAGWPIATTAVASVAWGDMDGDGTLDLLLGVYNGASQLLRRCALIDGAACQNENQLLRDTSWAPDSAPTLSVAFGDVDGDGDLDLAVGNEGSPVQLYRNVVELLRPAADPLPIADMTLAVAWGDANNDGRLDLAVGNFGSPSALWLNAGDGTFSQSFAWGPAGSTYALAWGDADNDGDLDLAVGNNDGQSVVYANCSNDGGSCEAPLRTEATLWTAPAPALTRAVAWGDADNDGDLDLLLANEADGASPDDQTRSQLYHNDGRGGLTLDEQWRPAPAPTLGAAWGDVDGDGDLDLALANTSAPSQLYRNCTYPNRGVSCAPGVTLALDPRWNPEEARSTSVTWGDVDGDGNLDLLLGNERQASQIFRNDGVDDANGLLALDAGWQPDPATTRAVALDDMDADGDLDLLLANDNNNSPGTTNQSRLYRNNGKGAFTLARWRPQAARSFSLAPGDIDGDGDLDLLLANLGAASQLFINHATGGAALRGPALTLAVARPFTAGAGELSAGRILADPVLPISYTLRGPAGSTVQALRAEYSLDGGGTWRAAIPDAGTPTTNLVLTDGKLTGTFNWNLPASGFFGQSDAVVVRLRAFPTPLASAVASDAFRYSGQAPSFQQATASASSFAFRARGVQLQVLDEAGNPVQGAVVYRLQRGLQRGATPMGKGADAFATDARGYLAGRGELQPEDRLVARAPIALGDTPASDPFRAKVALFATSAVSGATGQPAFVVPNPIGGAQQLRLGPQRLVLFNLVVGVEWDASADVQYQEQLTFDLQRASELLYDWSDGQVALGTLDVRYGPEALRDADIRVYANNRLRPWAFQGGIVASTLTEEVTVGGATKTLTYGPGYISMGPVWTRFGDSRSLGEDWPRALAHELGHFALFLGDNYLGRDKGELIAIPGERSPEACRGAMSDPYREDFSEFQPAGPEWDRACAQTLSAVESGRADWTTIKRFYDGLAPGFSLTEPPGFGAVGGPTAQALELTTVNFQQPTDTSTLLRTPLFALVRADGSRYVYQPGARVRAFLFSVDDSRIVDLGRPTLDSVLARGARLNDTLCVYDITSNLSGCARITAGLGELRLFATQPGWRPDARVEPRTPQQLRVTVPAAGVVTGQGPAPTLQVRLYSPELGASGPAPLTLRLADGADAYSGVIELPLAVNSAYLRVRVVEDGEAGGRRELVSEISISGAPLAPDTARLSGCGGIPGIPIGKNGCRAPVTTSPDGQLLIYGEPLDQGQFYTLQSASVAPPPPAWSILAGQPFRVVTSLSAAELTAKQTYITAAYLESELPAGTEGGLAIHYSADGRTWRLLTSSRFDPTRNEISAPLVGDGIYALITRLSVQPGWNVLSYPWERPTPVLEALAQANAAPGQFTTLYSYEPENPPGTDTPWRLYDIDAPRWVNSLATLTYGRGYWIRVVTPGALPLQSPADAELANLPEPPPATYYATIAVHPSRMPEGGFPVVAITNGEICARTHTRVVRDAGVDKVGFVLHVPAARVDTPPGCGQAGSLVAIVVDGKLFAFRPWSNDRPFGIFAAYLPAIRTP